MRVSIVGLLCALALVSNACSQKRAGSAPAPESEKTYVVVDNQQTETFTIYVTDGARRVRLGTAAPLGKTRLLIPSGVIFPAGQLQFLARPQGSDPSPISERISVSPGDVVGVTIVP